MILNLRKTIYPILFLVVVLFVVYKCDKNTAITLAGLTSILGILFTFYSKQIDIDFKEKELKQQLTVDKQKEHYINRIDAYMHLYNQSLKIKNDFTNNQKMRVEHGDIRHYSPCIDNIKILLNTFKNNIFYMSEDLDKEYKSILIKYDSCFSNYEMTKNYYPDYDITQGISEKEVQANIDKDLFIAYKCFCDNHFNELNILIQLIEKEVEEIRKKIQGKENA